MGSYMQPSIEAAGNITNGAVAPAFASSSFGCAVARTGTGVYTVTLTRPLNVADGLVLVSSLTASQTIQVVHTSDTVKTINVFSLVPAAADGTFAFQIIRFKFQA